MMSDLQSSSDHRDKGLMSPRMRVHEFRRIVNELRYSEDKREPTREETDGMQDLCFRLYSADVADTMAERLGVSRQQIREALDAGLKWMNRDRIKRAE